MSVRDKDRPKYWCVCVYLFPALWGPIVPTRIEIPDISDLMGTFYFINSL